MVFMVVALSLGFISAINCEESVGKNLEGRSVQHSQETLKGTM
jgi:hypothetical protein